MAILEAHFIQAVQISRVECNSLLLGDAHLLREMQAVLINRVTLLSIPVTSRDQASLGETMALSAQLSCSITFR